MKKRDRFFSISFKCPACFREVPAGNRFCIFCGREMAGSPPKAEERKPVASFYGGMPGTEARQEAFTCPNGHEVADASLGFCPVCGMPLVNDPHNGRQ